MFLLEGKVLDPEARPIPWATDLHVLCGVPVERQRRDGEARLFPRASRVHSVGCRLLSKRTCFRNEEIKKEAHLAQDFLVAPNCRRGANVSHGFELHETVEQILDSCHDAFLKRVRQGENRERFLQLYERLAHIRTDGCVQDIEKACPPPLPNAMIPTSWSNSDRSPNALKHRSRKTWDLATMR